MSCVIRGGGGGGGSFDELVKKKKKVFRETGAERKKKARHALFDWFLDTRSPTYMFLIFNFSTVRLIPPVRLMPRD